MPDVKREGDTWLITWAEQGVGIGVERVREKFDTLKAEITVTSDHSNRVLGPNTVDLLSARAQAEFANACAERVNGLEGKVWRAIVVHACSRVANDYREPTPTVNLANIPNRGPVPYMIPMLMPTAETTVLYGDGESAKSMMAVRIAYSVATGIDVPWGHSVTQGNVLYLDWETNGDTVASRLRRISEGMGTVVPENIFYKQCFRSLDDELGDIKEQIAKRQIKLVIIDSIGFAAAGSLVEDQTARTALAAMRQMAPATRLAIAHISKSNAETGTTSSPFGSRFFWNGMRSGIEMKRSEEAVSDDMIEVGVYHRKINDGRHMKPFGISVIFDENESISFHKANIAETPDLAIRTSLTQRIRAVLARGAMTTSDIAYELDTKPDTVSKTLRRMDGIIQITPGGNGRGQAAEWGLAE